MIKEVRYIDSSSSRSCGTVAVRKLSCIHAKKVRRNPNGPKQGVMVEPMKAKMGGETMRRWTIKKR